MFKAPRHSQRVLGLLWGILSQLIVLIPDIEPLQSMLCRYFESFGIKGSSPEAASTFSMQSTELEEDSVEDKT